MKKIIRRNYLDRLISLVDKTDIKIITGVRRSGKSHLLGQLKKHIRDTQPDTNIISLDLTSLEAVTIKNFLDLNTYVHQHYQEGKHNVVMIDEVQMCHGFERVINSLHSEEKYDIFITGSNAFLLNSDLATLFTGRYMSVEVFPFSLSEFMSYFELTDVDQAFDRYLAEGGFAGSYQYNLLEEKIDYVKNVYDSMIMRDIQQKYNVQNMQLMDSISNFMMDNISNLTSLVKVTNTLNSAGINTNHKTVGSYIHYLTDAFMLYKISRYNIKGKVYLNTKDKYYLVDHTLRRAKLGSPTVDIGRVYENLVAIELLRRGFEVYVGVFDEKEVDFVAIKYGEKYYIQVCAYMGSEETMRREITSLVKIQDNFPKIIMTRTRQDVQQVEGVQIVDIARWLSQTPQI